MFFLGALLQATCVSNGPQTIFDVILLQWLPVRFCGAGAIYGTGSAGRGTPFICKWNWWFKNCTWELDGTGWLGAETCRRSRNPSMLGCCMAKQLRLDPTGSSLKLHEFQGAGDVKAASSPNVARWVEENGLFLPALTRRRIIHRAYAQTMPQPYCTQFGSSQILIPCIRCEQTTNSGRDRWWRWQDFMVLETQEKDRSGIASRWKIFMEIKFQVFGLLSGLFLVRPIGFHVRSKNDKIW